MKPGSRQKTVAELLSRKLSAIIRTKERQLAADAMNAAVEGGFRIVEFTLTTPGALELVAEFARRDDLLVGAGTVLLAEQVHQAAEAGASFIVSPVCDPAILAEAGRLGLATIPGAFTPSEMLAAHRTGADLVKLFPAPANILDWITAVLGPLPFLRIFPTAGVSAENLPDVLRAGAVGAGFVRALFDPADMADRNFKSIERRAADIIRRLRDL